MASRVIPACVRLDDYYGIIKRDILTGSNAVPADRKLLFDKVTNVHYSGTQHDEDQPVHLLVHTEVCHTICGDEYGHPCVQFCPANVYEMVDDGRGTLTLADQRLELRPLQDLRHHGSVRRHHLGPARRRRRTAVRRACKFQLPVSSSKGACRSPRL